MDWRILRWCAASIIDTRSPLSILSPAMGGTQRATREVPYPPFASCNRSGLTVLKVMVTGGNEPHAV
jgi:hypothetical protein